MRDDLDVAVRLCQEHYTAARRQETQRSTLAQVILAIHSAAVAFVGASAGSVSAFRYPPAVLLVVLGLFGEFFSLKYYERFRFHRRVGSRFRDLAESVLSSIGTPAPLLVTIQNAGGVRQTKWCDGAIERVPLYAFWITLHLVVAAAGVLLLFTYAPAPVH